MDIDDVDFDAENYQNDCRHKSNNQSAIYHNLLHTM